MSHCPCCKNQMLRHIQHHHIYWFCRHCWQEMPDLKRSPGLLSCSPEDQCSEHGTLETTFWNCMANALSPTASGVI
ncbi:MAG TPA: hypothetical protein V6C78_34365 [Crinalium sp.]